jgi:hypothetical protein
MSGAGGSKNGYGGAVIDCVWGRRRLPRFPRRESFSSAAKPKRRRPAHATTIATPREPGLSLGNESKEEIPEPTSQQRPARDRGNSPALETVPRKMNWGRFAAYGAGGLVGIIALLIVIGWNFENSKIADVINSQFGRVCEAKVEGMFSNTLRLDWTAETKKLHMITVMAAVGKAKESIYAKGIRYLKFPNDAGSYNVIDWKTGEKSSIDERAPYYFRG